MKREMRLIKAYGANEAGIADVPNKMSGTMISRILIGDDSGCSHCFPHGYEVINSHYVNKQRKTEWK